MRALPQPPARFTYPAGALGHAALAFDAQTRGAAQAHLADGLGPQRRRLGQADAGCELVCGGDELRRVEAALALQPVVVAEPRLVGLCAAVHILAHALLRRHHLLGAREAGRDVQRDAAALPRAERQVAHFAQEERLPVAQQEQAHTRLAGARLPSPPTGTLATVHSRNVSVPVGCMLTHRAASAVDILLLRARRADLQDEGHIRVVHAAR